MIFVGFNILLNFKNFLGFLWKTFVSRKKTKGNFHSSANINRYSKLCFQFEFQSLGRLLDRFSTNSARKYEYWWLPKNLKNMYIPTVITTTFARLFLEDVPLLIIQIYVLTDRAIYDFTNMASLVSTIMALFMTLHTAWNVKPSTFNKNLFMRFFHQTKSTRKKHNEKRAKKEDVGPKKEQEKNKINNKETMKMEQAWEKEEDQDDEKEINEQLTRLSIIFLSKN